jgi:hypothetical protein
MELEPQRASQRGKGVFSSEKTSSKTAQASGCLLPNLAPRIAAENSQHTPEGGCSLPVPKLPKSLAAHPLRIPFLFLPGATPNLNQSMQRGRLV